MLSGMRQKLIRSLMTGIPLNLMELDQLERDNLESYLRAKMPRYITRGSSLEDLYRLECERVRNDLCNSKKNETVELLSKVIFESKRIDKKRDRDIPTIDKNSSEEMRQMLIQKINMLSEHILINRTEIPPTDSSVETLYRFYSRKLSEYQERKDREESKIKALQIVNLGERFGML